MKVSYIYLSKTSHGISNIISQIAHINEYGFYYWDFPVLLFSVFVVNEKEGNHPG